MIFLIFFTFSIHSIIVCSEMIATRQQPKHRAYDGQQLFIDYSSSFRGIDATSQARLISSEGHNRTIINNLVKINVCKEYDWLNVEIDGVKSKPFSHVPYIDEDIVKSIRNKTCKGSNNNNEVLFDIEAFRAENFIYDSCLKYVQFRSKLTGDQKIGPEILNKNTVVEVLEEQFRVTLQMHVTAPKANFAKSEMMSCPDYEQLTQVKEQESNTGLLIPGVVSLLVILVIGAIIVFVKLKKKPTNTEIDQNPEYGQQEYYYDDQQKRTNIVEENEEYYGGGAYATDQECYVKDSNNAYSD